MAKLGLQPPVQPITTLEALGSFVRTQAQRYARVNSLIANAESAMDKIRKAAAPPPSVTTLADRQLLQQAADVTARPKIMEIKDATEKEILPLIKTMKRAAKDAKLIGERWWTRWAILERAGTGTNDAAGDLQRRANWVTVLSLTGATALRDYMQRAVDAGDLLLAYCVLLVNGKRGKEASFASADAFSVLRIADFDTAQGLLAQVGRDAELAEIAYIEWHSGRSQSVRRIAVALAARQDPATTGDKLRDASMAGTGMPGSV